MSAHEKLQFHVVTVTPLAAASRDPDRDLVTGLRIAPFT